MKNFVRDIHMNLLFLLFFFDRMVTFTKFLILHVYFLVFGWKKFGILKILECFFLELYLNLFSDGLHLLTNSALQKFIVSGSDRMVFLHF